MRQIAGVAVTFIACVFCGNAWSSDARIPLEAAAAGTDGAGRSIELAQAGGHLSGNEIKALLAGKTVRLRRQRGKKTFDIKLRLGADGSALHTCKATHSNIRWSNVSCRVPSASGNWAVRGNKLCLQLKRRSCLQVLRSGGGHAFKARNPKAIYAGPFTVGQ